MDTVVAVVVSKRAACVASESTLEIYFAKQAEGGAAAGRGVRRLLSVYKYTAFYGAVLCICKYV